MKSPTQERAGDTGFLSHSLVLGTVAGTKIRLHWTFLVYLTWLGMAFLLGGGVAAALSGLALIIGVFACVVAHEFGHITMARRFGVASPDVTLLPIGGMARLQAIPERPGQELAIALAGPAVNLVIASLLFVALGPGPGLADLAAVLEPKEILRALAAINLFLALFNLVPAFPMDGGRAFRAVLSIFLDRAKATRIAARVGQAIAVGFGFLGVFTGNAILILIALFVYFAANAEAQDVQLHRLAERLRVADAAVTEILPLSASDTLDDAIALLLRSEQREFPVLESHGKVAGVLTREGIIQGLSMHGPHLPVTRAMLRDLPSVLAESPLDEALSLMEGNSRPVVVLDRDGRLAGLLTRENLAELLLLANARSRGEASHPAHHSGRYPRRTA